MIKDYAVDNSLLIQRVAIGDEDAKNELILQNMGLVHSIVRRFLGRGHESEDLFQIGCIGLIQAAKRFDPEYGVMFSTYAVPMIMGEIKRFIRDDGIIRVSRSIKETAVKAMKASEQLRLKSGREPSVAEIADALDISAAELAAALESQVAPQSLYIQAEDGEGKALIDKLESDEDKFAELLDKLTINQAMQDFADREKLIIYLRYYRLETQACVAKKLGISQVQVSRLEKKILGKLREKILLE